MAKEEKKEEAKTEVFDDIIKYNKLGWLRVLTNIVVWLALIFLSITSIIAFTNFTYINDQKDPYWYFDKEEYTKDNKQITSYNYFVFKVVEVESTDERSVNLTFVFISDSN